ncbi:hypothetical protein IE81DRAFT_328356 [Ceraceosorus guamensis]|uniref:G-protein coupled receptors family 1 profile domain-containing protein n=1 Tax=Ceraceosorus guamensis TaxID=1522189 RepID=A0A316W8K5_9BASI|nr:hypothetical protein IE81DRAFT_328356 [Ceraceosorus guamensis]PWN45091.1 hypothetical protein IE81DRAFT_328356 [Ceraceosorus guamensis]
MPITSTPEGYLDTAVKLTQFNARQAIFMAFWTGFMGLFATAFVLLSTPAQRRRPLFSIQCILLILTLIYNGIDLAYTYLYTANFIEQLGQNRSQPTPWPEAEPTIEIMSHLLPFLIDLTLIIKVAAFYPKRIYYVAWRRLLPIAPLIVVALARLATMIYSVQQWYLGYVTLDEKVGVETSDDNPLWIAELRATRNATKAALAETILQIVFCAYASGILLYKAVTFLKHAERSPALKRSIVFLVEAILMSFLPPLIVQIISIGLTASTSSNTSISFAAAYCRALNVYLSMIFSILATSWSTIRLAIIGRIGTERSGGMHPKHSPNQAVASPEGRPGSRQKGADQFLFTSMLGSIADKSTDSEQMEVLRTDIFESPTGWTQETDRSSGKEHAKI